MVSRKQKVRMRWSSIIIFMLFSIILLINNVSDLSVKFNLYVTIQWISWIALIGVTIYTIYLAMEDKI